MSIIKAKTEDRNIVLISDPELTSGDENLDVLAIRLDSSWLLSKADYYINFFLSDESEGIIKEAEKVSNICACAIPNKMFEREGSFYFGIFAKTPDGIVKTSKMVEYRVKKGIATSADGVDIMTLAELKSKFIRMINANTFFGMLDEEMDFDNEIEPTYCSYMNTMYAVLSDYQSFVNDIFKIIKKYIYPDIEPLNNNITLAAIIYTVLLQDYFENSVSRASFDSVNDELTELNLQKQQLLEELNQKDRTLDNIKNIFERLYIGGAANGNS